MLAARHYAADGERKVDRRAPSSRTGPMARRSIAMEQFASREKHAEFSPSWLRRTCRRRTPRRADVEQRSAAALDPPRSASDLSRSATSPNSCGHPRPAPTAPARPHCNVGSRGQQAIGAPGTARRARCRPQPQAAHRQHPRRCPAPVGGRVGAVPLCRAPRGALHRRRPSRRHRGCAGRADVAVRHFQRRCLRWR